jgi:hypothetical protein
MNLEVNGKLVVWKCKASSYDAVLQAAEDAGFPQHCPARPSDKAALRSALAAYYKGVDGEYIVKPIKEGDGYEVVRVEGYSSERNDHHHEASVTLSEGEIVCLAGYIPMYQLKNLFTQEKNRVSGAAVGGMLAAMVLEYNATSLRPNGGVYWLPHDDFMSFKAVMDAVKGLGVVFFTAALEAL